MAERTNVPEIRFAGFTDPWEQRKFSDMYEVNNERNTDCELGYDRTLSIATMTFNGGNGAADDSLNSYKVIRVGDIAFEGHANKVHAYGRFVLNDAGDGLMSPRFSCLRPIVEQRYSFWKYYISHEETMRSILVNATKSGTMMNELVPDDLMRESILVPCLAEQEVIGDSLSQLDSLITLHQRKHDKLVQLKKSMLDKMFPKPGETEPEIRFAGFTDPWEQRKLGELLLFQNGFNGSSESFGSGIPLISVMDVLDDEFITHETVRGKARLNCEEASRYCVEYGDVLFQRSSENQEDAGTSNVYLDQHVSSAFGGFVIRGKKVGEYNPIFIKYLLGSPFIREQITHRAQGAQHINVSQDTLADVVLLMPSMREQEAVGLVFLHLDNLITLHQRKLELLRNTKKSLLDRMFV